MLFGLPDWTGPLAALFVGGASAFAVARPRYASRKIPAQPSTSDLLPWIAVQDDGKTVVIKDASGRRGAARVYRLAGLPHSALTDASAKAAWRARFDWLNSLKDRHGLAIRFLSTRSHVELLPPPPGDNFLSVLDDLWHAELDQVYRTEHYIIASIGDERRKADLDTFEESLDALAQFGPEPLTTAEDAGASPLNSFLYSLAAGARLPMVPRHSEINIQTGSADIVWHADGIGEITDGWENRYVAVLSHKTMKNHTAPEIIADLLAIPGEISVFLDVEPISAKDQKDKIERTRNLTTAKYINQIVAKEFADAIDEVDAGKVCFYPVQLVIFLRASTRPALETLRTAARRALGGRLGEIVTERRLAFAHYTNQWPGMSQPLRKFRLDTNNLTDLTPWIAEPPGREACEWGPRPVRYLPTAQSRAPYAFCYHVPAGEVPHYGIIAGTGGGKTVLDSFLTAGALSAYPALRAFAFDRDLGLRVVTEAFEDSEYLIPGTASLPLNPLLVDDGPEAIDKTEQLFRILSGLDDDESRKALAFAARAAFDPSHPKAERKMSGLFEALFEPGKVKDAMHKWCVSGQYAHIFNGDRDAFQIGTRFTVADMTTASQDPVLSAALTYYFVTRFRDQFAGQPHKIFLDEASTLLQVPALAEAFQTFLRTKRKESGCIGFAFQGLRDVTSSPIASTLLDNIPTWFLWPGIARTREECQAFRLTTEWEISFALGEAQLPDAVRRPILIKRPNESVLIDLDLSPLGPYLRVFKGGPTWTERMHQAIKENGPEHWLTAYVSGAYS